MLTSNIRSVRAENHNPHDVRPVGSTNGRVPPGGYPSVSDRFAAFLTGFIEGEGSFSIGRNGRGFGFRPKMSLSARDDDADLINALYDATRIGRVTRKRAYRSSEAQVVWTVSAKSDCLRLIDLIERAPLRGRKGAAYVPWKRAVAHWTADGPTARLTPSDWQPFPGLKADLERANRFNPERSLEPIPFGTDMLPYLAGFATAEGHFAIDKQLRPRFILRLRLDDQRLLAELQAATCLGRVYGPYARSGNAGYPATMWVIFSTPDLIELVRLFEQCAPGGRKGLEFAFWRQAVLDRSQTASARRARLALVRERLMGLRQYRSPSGALGTKGT